MATTLPRDNRLLARIPASQLELFIPMLTPVDLGFRQTLFEPPNVPALCFPTTALFSIVRIMEDGRSVEVGSIGREGVVGLNFLAGDGSNATRFVSQVPGQAYCVPIQDFVRESPQLGLLRDTLVRYADGLFFQITQWSACNILHSVEQRCCRWLTVVRDRTGQDEFPLTHDFLSQMLGVRRASVTEVARTLQDRGLIRYRRGQMAIVSPDGLEEASCECYRRVRDEFNRLFT